MKRPVPTVPPRDICQYLARVDRGYRLTDSDHLQVTILEVSLELWLMFRFSIATIFLNIDAAQLL